MPDPLIGGATLLVRTPVIYAGGHARGGPSAPTRTESKPGQQVRAFLCFMLRRSGPTLVRVSAPVVPPALYGIMSEFLTQLTSVKNADQDFEWYPTTAEIILSLTRSIKEHADEHLYDRHRSRSLTSFLDIGAGNGKVLDAVRNLRFILKLHAIEKSRTLINLLPADIYILGVDFWNTSLIDKNVDVIFSNPPYFCYVEWTSKILKEARPGALIYLVIPDRWEQSSEILRAIKGRDATHAIIGSFDFDNSEDRKARTKVHLLKIVIGEIERNTTDLFAKYFDETFKYPKPEEAGKSMDEKIDETKLFHRVNLIEALCLLHDPRMLELQHNYASICKLPFDILKELRSARTDC